MFLSYFRETHDPLDRRREADQSLLDTAEPHSDSRFGSSDTLRDLSAEPDTSINRRVRGELSDPGSYRDQFGRVKSPPGRDPYIRGREGDDRTGRLHSSRDRTIEGHYSGNLDTQRSDRHLRGMERDRDIPGETTYDVYGNPKTSLSGRRGLDRDDPRDVDQYSDRSAPGRQHLDPSSAAGKSSRSRRKLDSMFRNDSLSSDPSDCVRPPPPKPHKHKKGKKVSFSCVQNTLFIRRRLPLLPFIGIVP